MPEKFLPGIDVLANDHPDWIAGKRIGLVGHAASVDAAGVPSPEIIRRDRSATLTCAHAEHPIWSIPVHSLYGATRRPTREMLQNVDVIVFDIQSVAARAYTYVSTLRHVLEAAAENEKIVIVADRPDPLANLVDGPMLKPSFESFVGFIRTPVVYGMTPAETARWIEHDLHLALDLRQASMHGYSREPRRLAHWPTWIPPSPAIRTWECGICFGMTVFLEALPSIDHGRGTATPFQLFGAPWLDSAECCASLNDLRLPGLAFEPCRYRAMSGLYTEQEIAGVRISLTDATAIRPVQTGIAIVQTIEQQHGRGKVWEHEGTRPDFFDKLMGTDDVRLALLDDAPAAVIAESWTPRIADFVKTRNDCLLYE
jgi:uncharacterized protein YbbC (DUF1343 family)